MQVWRWLEMCLIFWVVPAIFIFVLQQPERWMLPALVVLALLCASLLLRDKKFKRFRLYHTQNIRQHFMSLLRFFLPLALLLSLVTYWLKPELLFFLPVNKPDIWLLTLLVYPFFSVLPQELIFRTFFFHRYKHILPSKTWRLGISSGSFAFAHGIYGNWVAVLLSGVAGLLLGYRYIQTRSTLVVVVEHILWGSFLFTMGIGIYFLHAANS